MKFCAINQALDDILQCLGLTRKEDILSVRGYCERKLRVLSALYVWWQVPLPSEPVAVIDKQMLYMAESEDMPNLLAEDPEINFMGFGSTTERFNETIPLDSTTSQPSSFLAFPPVPDLPPEQLMEGYDLAQVCWLFTVTRLESSRTPCLHVEKISWHKRIERISPSWKFGLATRLRVKVKRHRSCL